MRIEILLPSRVLVSEEVSSVVAEGREGSFGVLERHIDYVSALVPGIPTFTRKEDGTERIFASPGQALWRGISIERMHRRATRDAAEKAGASRRELASARPLCGAAPRRKCDHFRYGRSAPHVAALVRARAGGRFFLQISRKHE